MKKKLLSLALAGAVLLASSSAPAYAADYSSGSSANCTVSATVDSTYTVSIPASLSLSYSESNHDYRGTFTIGAKGNIDATKKLTCAPAASTFDLTGQHNNSNVVSATVTQEKTEWLSTEVNTSTFSETSGLVTADLVVADEYQGTLTFNYAVVSTT